MTRFAVMSDLHLEFNTSVPELPDADVLLLAGDITTAAQLSLNDIHRTYVHMFMEQAVQKYQHVFYVMGNHEHYHSDYLETQKLLKNHLPRGVKLLENKHVKVNGTDLIVVGCTMWTNMGDGVYEFPLMKAMNDFRVVQHGSRFLTPSDVRLDHTTSVGYIRSMATRFSDKRIVVLTHHAPSSQGCDLVYAGSWLNCAFYEDVSPLIDQKSNIVAWVHGHTHISRSYDIYQCRVYSNARGYIKEPSFERFNPSMVFDL